MKRVLCYGDSNTFGTMPMAALTDDGIFPKDVRWAGVLAVSLGEEWDVVVEGLPGRTTALDDPIEGAFLNGRKSFQPILMSHRPIDLLILCLGTNDAKTRFGLRSQDIALGIQRLLLDAAMLGVVGKTLAICPPLVRERGDLAEIFHGAEARTVRLPKEMERFARLNGAEFFDANEVIEPSSVDGVHWSQEAHAKFGQAVANKAREMFS